MRDVLILLTEPPTSRECGRGGVRESTPEAEIAKEDEANMRSNLEGLTALELMHVEADDIKSDSLGHAFLHCQLSTIPSISTLLLLAS